MKGRLDTLVADLAAEARRFTCSVHMPDQELAEAAIRFVTCAAIHLGENPATMRDLEQRLHATIEAWTQQR